MAALHMALLVLALGNAGDMVLLDFTATWCGPCRQMDPIVRQLQAQGFPIQQIDVDRQPELAQQFRVTGVPCFVLVSGGREVDRIEGATDAQRLIGMFQSVNPPGGVSGDVARGQSPDVDPFAAAVNSRPPAATAAPSSAGSHLAVSEGDPALLAAVDPEVIQRAKRATVRIRIGDGRGNSVGTGTIVDARSGEALVLTCGHIFRESQGRGQLLIDTFSPGGPQNVPATLIGYDLESDVGLISFRCPGGVSVCPVATDAGAARVGDVVVSVGCSHGEAPTARVSKVTSIDKFLGPSNLQVAGQPVQGRSGGGLFDRSGRLIGVCNAADPQDNEGLFAALKSIHAQLQKLDLADLLLGAGPAAAVASTPAAAPPAAVPAGATSANPPPLADSATPAMPAAMPAGGIGSITPVAHVQELGTDADPLSAEEAAVLDELRKRAEGAEIIVIVRSRTDPSAKSEIIVLDRASPAFLRHLATMRSTSTARQETGMRWE